VAGIAALAVAVGCAGWLAVGAAGGPRWLELPAGDHPGWLQGPLHGLASSLGSLTASGLSAPLLALGAAYLGALACAASISPRAALAAVAAANLAFTLGPTIVSSDVFGYIAYARELALHGLNPYVFPPTALGHDAILLLVYWKHEPSPYGPLFTLASAPLGLLSPAAALWTFKTLAGLASVGTAFMVSRIAGRRGIDRSRAAIFVGLNPVILFYAVSGAHNDLLSIALVVCGLALLAERRVRAGVSGVAAGASGAGQSALAAGGAGQSALAAGGAGPSALAAGGAGPSALAAGGAGAAAVAAAAVKVTVGLALPFVLILAHRRRRGRAALGGTGLALVAIGIPALALFGTHLFDQLQRITTEAKFDTAWSGPDLVARALRTHITTGLRTVCTAVALAVALLMLLRAWRGADAVAAPGWAFLALLASIASLAPWYLVWVLPFAALGRSRALWIAALLVSGYMLAVHLPALGGHPWLAGPPGG
jgi:hypothetical protein